MMREMSAKKIAKIEPIKDLEVKGCSCSIDIDKLYLEALKRGDTAIYDPEGLIVCEMDHERKVIPMSEIRKIEEERKKAGILGGALLGWAIGGPVGGILGGIVGLFLAELKNEVCRKDICNCYRGITVRRRGQYA